MQNITVQRFEEAHAARLSEIIKKNLLEINIKDYEESLMERVANSYSPGRIQEIAAAAHMYVVLREGEPVACGAIAPVDGNPEESYMLSIFVNVDMHGKGLGRIIMQALEEDEYGTRATRIEIPSSITACEFYRRLGYDFKEGKKQLDDEGLYRLEKFILE